MPTGIGGAVENAVENVRRGNWGEVGEDVGQIQYAVIEAVVGTKGAGLALRGVRTGAQVGLNATKGLIGAQRLAQIAAKSSQVLNRVKFATSGIVRVGRRVVDAIDESKRAFSRSDLEYKKLPKELENKTVATDGEKTLSGWQGKSNVRPVGYRDVSPNDVKAYSGKIGHNLQNGGANDQISRGGFRGKYHAPHAEKQMAVARPNEPIGVSRPMCPCCQRFFSKHAQYQGKPQVVTDPDGTRIFNPDGTVTRP